MSRARRVRRGARAHAQRTTGVSASQARARGRPLYGMSRRCRLRRARASYPRGYDVHHVPHQAARREAVPRLSCRTERACRARGGARAPRVRSRATRCAEPRQLHAMSRRDRRGRPAPTADHGDMLQVSRCSSRRSEVRCVSQESRGHESVAAESPRARRGLVARARHARRLVRRAVSDVSSRTVLRRVSRQDGSRPAGDNALRGSIRAERAPRRIHRTPRPRGASRARSLRDVSFTGSLRCVPRKSRHRR
jgi:hypothetical protein